MHSHNLQNKLIGSDTDSVEVSLIHAIRRAASAGDQTRLLALADQVGALAQTAKVGCDTGLMGTVKRLLSELRAANGGPKIHRPIMEYKNCALAFPVARRSAGAKFASGKMKVEGYGSTFGGPPDAYGDVIAPGAFAKSLARHRAAGTLPRMFFSHDVTQVPGLWTSMSEDSKGLVTAGVLANTTLGRDLNELIELGAVDSLSIGFRIPEGGASFDRNGLRTLKEIDLCEVSIVSLPANPRAQLNSAPADNAVHRFGIHAGRSFENDIQRAVAQARRASASDISADMSGRLAEVIPISRAAKPHDDEAEIVRALNRLNSQLERH